MNFQDDILQQTVSALKKGLKSKLVAIVLFGSQARNQASDRSDCDLLLIARDLPEKKMESHLFLKRMIPFSYRGAISLFAKTPEEFESHLPSLYLDIALDGKILHDTNDYALEHLSKLKRLIDQMGLERQKTSDGFVWKWTKPPPENRELTWRLAS